MSTGIPIAPTPYFELIDQATVPAKVDLNISGGPGPSEPGKEAEQASRFLGIVIGMFYREQGPIFEPLRDPAFFKNFTGTLIFTRSRGRTGPTSHRSF